MSKIDKDAEPVAFLDDGGPECGQATKAGRVRVDVAEWHGSVAVVKEPKMSQTPLVCFFHPHKLTFEKVTAFDRLDDRWPAVLVGGTKSSRGIGIKIPPVWCEGE